MSLLLRCHSAPAFAIWACAPIPAIADTMTAKLREMQRVRRAWRDETCAPENAQWGGGSKGAYAEASCRKHLTGQQVQYLERAGPRS